MAFEVFEAAQQASKCHNIITRPHNHSALCHPKIGAYTYIDDCSLILRLPYLFSVQY